VIDAELVTPGAEPGIFAAIRVTVPSQVAEPDPLDRIHVSRVDRPVSSTYARQVLKADGQGMGFGRIEAGLGGRLVSSVDRLLPARTFGKS